MGERKAPTKPPAGAVKPPPPPAPPRDESEKSFVCSGCAEEYPIKRVHYCCGFPFCLRCYETHVEEEHVSHR